MAAHPAGDHTIFVAEVAELTTRDGAPLLWFDSGFERVERR